MDKAKILSLVSEALENGTIVSSDLRYLLYSHDEKSSSDNDPTARVSVQRTSAVDIMFYIAAIVLFAAIVALIGQSWDSGSAVRILLSAGIGTLFWTVALLLLQSPTRSDIRRGITNASLLAGSLAIIAGGFIIANEFADYNNFNFYATATAFMLLGALHVLFGWQIKRSVLTLLGILLSVAAFPTLIFGLLNGSDAPMFVNCLVVAVSGALLAYATRVASWVGLVSSDLARAFDPLGTFIALMSLYVATYDEGSGLLWLLVLIGGIIGMFYLSIVRQDRLMLGNGSLFLVIAIITVSFRYFDGYGVSVSLLLAALGLLGTAIVATTINRRYITSA